MVPDRLSSTEQLIVNSNAGSGAYSSHRACFLPSFAGRAGGSGSDDCAVCQQRFPSTGSNLLPPTQPGVCRAGAAWAGGGRRMDSLLLRDRFHFTRAIACAAGRGQAQRGCRQAGVLLGPAGSCWVLLGPAGSYWAAIGTLLGGSPGPAWQSRELGTCHQLLSPLLPAHREGGGALFPVQQAGGERA